MRFDKLPIELVKYIDENLIDDDFIELFGIDLSEYRFFRLHHRAEVLTSHTLSPFLETYRIELKKN